jgi:regulator of sirC expression with transglutaminase-like and TPR domain
LCGRLEMKALRAALRGDSSVMLDAAALEIAAIESPGLDPAPCLAAVDLMALELGSRLPSEGDGPRFVQLANDYLFGELGFRGNETEYDDPRNSCLNLVLDRRRGIPISLSVVYIEVARRLGKPVCGIGLPGHFVVRYEDAGFSTYIDPFHAGKLLTEKDCRALAHQITGVELSHEASALAPVSVRYILVRILNNLRAAYFKSKQYAKATVVLDLLVEQFPANADYYKARGVARLKLRELGAARSDLKAYLKHAPDADDTDAVKQQLQAIHRWLGRLN